MALTEERRRELYDEVRLIRKQVHERQILEAVGGSLDKLNDLLQCEAVVWENLDCWKIVRRFRQRCAKAYRRGRRRPVLTHRIELAHRVLGAYVKQETARRSYRDYRILYNEPLQAEIEAANQQALAESSAIDPTAVPAAPLPSYPPPAAHS